MSRRTRTSYMRVMNKGGSPVSCASWIHGPDCRKEDVGHAIIGRSGSNEGNPCGRLQVLRYDFKQDILSDAIHNEEEKDIPQAIVVHPGGDGVICSYENSCKLYEIEKTEQLKLKVSDRDLLPLQGIGPQRCLLFSLDGSRFVAGGKDGHLRVFEWPSLNILFDQPEGCKFLSSLDISLDGAFLASIPDSGNFCRVWDIEKSSVAATISHTNKGELFGSCRFSRDGTKPFLFITITKGGKGAIGVWEMEAWNKIGTKTFSKDLITSFAASHDGKWLGIGSVSGSVYLIEVRKMQTVELVKEAHLSAVKTLEFSPNSRAFLSISSDSTVLVTKLHTVKVWKDWQIYSVLLGMILVSAALFFIFYTYSDSFWKFPVGPNQSTRTPPEAIYERITDFDGGEFM